MWMLNGLVVVLAVSCACTVRDVPVDVGCDGAAPIMQPGDVEPSGYERCGDDFVHRREAATCVVPEPPATCTSDSGGSCSASSECTARPHGACIDGASAIDGCECVYGCERDADCAADEVCACIGAVDAWPQCVPASCHTDADCDGLCGFSRSAEPCGGFSYALACLEPGSECRAECPEERGCFGNLGVPPCEVVGAAWTCNADRLCEDCG